MGTQPKLVIFDMDGLMFDTENLTFDAMKELAAQYEVEMTKDFYCSLIGRSEQSNRAPIAKKFANTNMAPESFKKELWSIRKRIIAERGTLGVKPGLVELLKALKAARIPLAVASSSHYDDVIANLELEGVRDYFSFIVAGNQVRESKPNPEIFQIPCQHFKVEPKDAVVLEDSLSGFLAGRAAGIPVCFVPDMLEATSEIQQKAAGVFENLLEVKAYLLG